MNPPPLVPRSPAPAMILGIALACCLLPLLAPAASTLGPYPLNAVWQKSRADLTADATPPAVLQRQDYLANLRAITHYFRRYQEPDGRIIDLFHNREVQNSTACYAFAAATLVTSGTDTNLLTSAALALDYTLQRLVTLNERSPGADLVITPAILAYQNLTNHIAPDRTRHWQNLLRAIAPQKAYHDRLTDSRTRVTSYNVAALSGEFLRHAHGLGDPAFLNQHLPVQLRNFTIDGLYRDTYAPLAYDGFSRHFLAHLLTYNYRGPGQDLLAELLDRGAVTALLSQSPIGEVPTGGRGSQHQWNEAQQLFLFELWATRKKAEGDTVAAHAFKRGAQLSWQSLLRWVRPSGEFNIVKNAFDPAAQHGFERFSSHSHFNLFTAYLLALAWYHADDSITARAAPADLGGFVFQLAEFRKIIANAGGLYLEIDTKADTNYQSTGFIRIHKTGVEGVVGPSDATPLRRDPLAIGVAWRENNAWQPLAAENFDFVKAPKVTVFKTTTTNVNFSLLYPVGRTNVASITEHYDLTPQRVQVTTTLQGTAPDLRLRFPALVFTGVRATTLQLTNATASVTLGKSRQTIQIIDPPAATWQRTGEVLPHRNGYVEPLEATLATNRVVFTLTPELLP